MTKLIAAFRNFAQGPKKDVINRQESWQLFTRNSNRSGTGWTGNGRGTEGEAPMKVCRLVGKKYFKTIVRALCTSPSTNS
jgi:hypothetical protein